MNTFACATIQDALIFSGFALGLVAVMAFIINRVFKSGGSK